MRGEIITEERKESRSKGEEMKDVVELRTAEEREE